MLYAIEEMVLELTCQATVCTQVMGGIRWKTPALGAELAMQMVNIHRADAHDQEAGGGGRGAQHSGGGKVQLSKIPQPKVGGGCS